MSPKKQRIAILEFCGWKRDKDFDFKTSYETVEIWSNGSRLSRFENLPDYLNDWNAMREAVNGLDEHHRLVFLDRLSEITVNKPGSNMKWFPVRITEATLADYAKAFLRAIAKWEES